MSRNDEESAQGTVAASATGLGLGLSNLKARIYRDFWYNDHTDGLEITVYIVPSGGSAAAATTVRKFTVGAGQSLSDVLTGAVVPRGGDIYAVTGTAAKVTYTISYAKISG